MKLSEAAAFRGVLPLTPHVVLELSITLGGPPSELVHGEVGHPTQRFVQNLSNLKRSSEGHDRHDVSCFDHYKSLQVTDCVQIGHDSKQ